MFDLRMCLLEQEVIPMSEGEIVAAAVTDKHVVPVTDQEVVEMCTED